MPMGRSALRVCSVWPLQYDGKLAGSSQPSGVPMASMALVWGVPGSESYCNVICRVKQPPTSMVGRLYQVTVRGETMSS